MNTVNPYLKQYKKNQVETATREQILILLYDGAINFLNKAKIAIEENDDGLVQKNLLGCEKILIEFMNTLDMDQGGQIAETLYALYRYYYKTLVTVGISKNVEKLDEVLKHLTNLRNTWQKAIEISNAERNTNLIESSTNIVSPNDLDSTAYVIKSESSLDGEDEYENDDDNEDEEDSDSEYEEDEIHQKNEVV